jgi:hypothetical protein
MDLSQYQGRRWVTRQHLHIDRLACIWLIKRFVDRRGRFFFVAEREETKGGVGFDMFGVDLTHHGEDCTFETMLKRFGLGDDPGLCGIAEIVHDIDLKDRKFTRKEAAGLDTVVTGLALFLKNGHATRSRSPTSFWSPWNEKSEEERNIEQKESEDEDCDSYYVLFDGPPDSARTGDTGRLPGCT